MNIPTIAIEVLSVDLDIITRNCKFKRGENNMIVSTDIDAIDYYGEFRGGVPWIAQPLIDWATANGGYWEWENAEMISFTK